jgi:hypothetical protein
VELARCPPTTCAARKGPSVTSSSSDADDSGTSYAFAHSTPVGFGVATTSRPWELGLDALVISVGEGLGGLGAAVSHHMPELPWRNIAYSTVDPDSPMALRTSRDQPDPSLLVLASPHERDDDRTVTFDSVVRATVSAVEFAAHEAVESLGIPLLGTGRLGLPVEMVVARVVPALLNVTLRLGKTALREIVFFDRTNRVADMVRLQFQAAPSGSLRFDPRVRVDFEPVELPAELAAGHSVDLVDPTRPISLDQDCLGMRPYVSMLATLIASRETQEPLSIGVFGDWGSGKSYFMGMLRGEIQRLGVLDGERYYRHIKPVAFNAWTYADANLWASLGDEVFRQLLGAPQDSVANDQKNLRDDLTRSLEQRKLLEAAAERAKAEAAILQAELDRAAADRNVRISDVAKAVLKSPTVQAEAGNALLSGLDKEAVVREALLAQEVAGTAAEGRALIRSARARNGAVAIGSVAVLAVIVGVLATFLAPHLQARLYMLSVVFGTAAATAEVIAARARSTLKLFRVVTEELRTGIDDVQQSALRPKLDALHQAQARHHVAQAQLQEVVTRIGELGRQLVELTPGARLYSLITDRVSSEAYGRNLGLISMVRRDFGELVRLLHEHRSAQVAESSENQAVIDRIVLYIDDLDRCTPRRVVEVLEAVHLLLAIPLFVVVIGVDPRWLLRALSAHYSEILSNQAGTSAVAPEDYLEKIINVPIILPHMTSTSMGTLVKGLLAEQVIQQSPGDPQPGAPFGPIEFNDSEAEQPEEAGLVEVSSEVATQRAGVRPSPRAITDEESALLGSLGVLIDTPRDAKRLVNIYRMIRATRDLSDAADFLGDADRPGDYQAVALLLGLTTFNARLAEQVFRAPASPDAGVAGGALVRSSDRTWRELVADLNPVAVVGGCRNGVVGNLAVNEVDLWVRAHRGLEAASEQLTLPDLTAFQSWIPKIRRFSFIMADERS